MSKYTIQHSPDGSMSIIFDFERFLPVTGAGYIFNATHDGNVTIGDLTCDARGTVQCIVYLYNSSLKRFLSFCISGTSNINLENLATLEKPLQKILDGNLKDFGTSFKVKAIMGLYSQNIDCLKLFEICNHVFFSISYCPSNQTLVFRSSADNSLFNVPLQYGHENKVFVLTKDDEKILKISVYDDEDFKNSRSKELDFAKFQAGFKQQFTIFNETKEQYVKVYDFWCSVEV